MVMSPWTMRMSVCHFVIGGSSYIDDFNVIVKCLSRQGVVGVDIGKFEADLGDDHMARALFGLYLGDHAPLPAFGPHQMLDRHALHGIGLARTVGFFRSDGNAERIASLTTFQGFFQTLDNTAVAMQVGVRLATTGILNFVALFITDTIVKQDHLILFDWHRVLYKDKW